MPRPVTSSCCCAPSSPAPTPRPPPVPPASAPMTSPLVLTTNDACRKGGGGGAGFLNVGRGGLAMPPSSARVVAEEPLPVRDRRSSPSLLTSPALISAPLLRLLPPACLDATPTAPATTGVAAAVAAAPTDGDTGAPWLRPRVRGDLPLVVLWRVLRKGSEWWSAGVAVTGAAAAPCARHGGRSGAGRRGGGRLRGRPSAALSSQRGPARRWASLQ